MRLARHLYITFFEKPFVALLYGFGFGGTFVTLLRDMICTLQRHPAVVPVIAPDSLPRRLH